jgi:hypothetical protein
MRGRDRHDAERGMSTVEYAVLIAVAGAAAAAMFTYVMNATQANIRNMELELNAAVSEEVGGEAP